MSFTHKFRLSGTLAAAAATNLIELYFVVIRHTMGQLKMRDWKMTD